MKRLEIETRIAELDAEIQKCEAVLDENQQAYKEAEKNLESNLLSYLKDAGFPVDERTKASTSIYSFTTPENKKVTASFTSDGNTEFNVEFYGRKVAEVRAYGISSRGGYDDLARVEAYYKMVAIIMERLTSKYFDTNMVLFFEALENYAYPEMKKLPDEFCQFKEEKARLERELKIMDLNLEVGKKVEVYINNGTGRRYRGHYTEMTVEKITEKTISLESRAYGSKVIKKEEALDRIRNIKVQEAV